MFTVNGVRPKKGLVLAFRCPSCKAYPGTRCSEFLGSTRREIDSYHDVRWFEWAKYLIDNEFRVEIFPGSFSGIGEWIRLHAERRKEIDAHIPSEIFDLS